MTIPRGVWIALALISAGAVAVAMWWADERARGVPIRIAFAGPTSGPSAGDGLSAVRAIKLLFDRVNGEGGVNGRPLVLDVYDDRNDPARARANAPGIADEPNTIAVIGHNYSTCSIAAGGIYAARGIPAVATAATSVAVTQDNRWYFRTIFNDLAQGRFIVVYVREILGADRFSIVHESDTYGAYLAGVMEDWAPQAGLTLIRSWSFDPASTKLDTRLDEIARETVAEAPEVLVLALQAKAGVAFVKRLRDLGFSGTLVASDTLASKAFVDGLRAFPAERSRPGVYTNGIFVSTPFLFDTGGKRAGVLLQEYVSRFDESPDWYAAFATDAASVLVEALSRSGISPRPASIAQDRAALRDSLAAIGPLDAVEGVTGPIWFDSVGDAQRPVPMGRFLGGEIVSAFQQLRLLPGVQNTEDLSIAYDPVRVVSFGEHFLYRTDVARVGVQARRFENVNFSQGTFDLEFDLWFRHQGDRSVEDVVFINALAPIELGEPVEQVFDGTVRYRRYQGRGIFRTDTIATAYGEHSLAVSLHPRERTRDDLIFAADTVGMNLGRQATRGQRTARSRRLLGPDSDWTTSDVIFFQSEVDEPAMGHPSYLADTRPVRSFSQLTLGLKLRRQATTLRGLVPAPLQMPLLVVAIVGALALWTLMRSLPRTTLALQGALALLGLVVAEPLLGNWLQRAGNPHQVEQLSRFFDVLWWLVPAFLINAAIDRFVWKPAEEASGRAIPTLLRYFVGFVIYLLALFGIVAFVYDHKLTGLLATSGVLAMIIGLAVQLNITNIFAGVALNLERPFHIGDWIMIHGRTPAPNESIIGMVTDINWRTTRLHTADNTMIVIPNGVISEKTITNFMAPSEMSRFELAFTVDQSVLPETVICVIQKAVDSVLGVENEGPLADPPPTVLINRTTENGIEYVVSYRLIPRDVSPLKARHTVNESVIRHLREADIELAYPRRRIREEARQDAVE